MRSHPTRRAVLASIGGTSAVGLAGCNSPIGGGEDQPVKIGVETMLTGPYSIQGLPSEAAAKLAEQRFNDEGGIDGRDVEVTVVNSEADPETGVTRVREMHQQENIEIIISQSGSSVGRAVSQYCADNDLLNFAGGYSADFSGVDCNKNTFQPFPNLVHILRSHVRGVAEQTDGVRLAGINPDYSYGQQSWDLFKTNFIDQVDGAEVVSETFPAFGKGDYNQEITQTLDAEPDVVHSSLYAGDMISFIQQAKEYDFFESVPVFAPSGTYDPVAKSLGEDMPEVLAGLPYFYTHPDTEMNNEFASAYIDFHGSPPTGNAHNVYSDMLAIKAAVEETGSTEISGMIDAIEGMEIEVPGGTLSIRASDHQGILSNLPAGWGGRSFDSEFYSPLTDITSTHGSDVVESPDDCSL